jgi:hypothetical protein
VRASPLERVLERHGVEEGGEHARVVGSCAVHPLGRGFHAAVDVPRADNDRELDSGVVDADDLARDVRQPVAVDPVLLLARERLAESFSSIR